MNNRFFAYNINWTQGNESKIKTFSFRIWIFVFLIAHSETKWHKGGRFKKWPIWFDVFQDIYLAAFVWKTAFMVKFRSQNYKKDL